MFPLEIPIYYNNNKALLCANSNDFTYFSFALIHPKGKEIISIHKEDSNFLYLSHKDASPIDDEIIREIWHILEQYDWPSMIGTNIKGFKRSITNKRGETCIGTVLI